MASFDRETVLSAFDAASLNGKAVFIGDDPACSRDYRFLGTVGFCPAIYLKGFDTLACICANIEGLIASP